MDEKLAMLCRDLEASLALEDSLADRALVELHRLTGKKIAKEKLASTDSLLGLIGEFKPGWHVSVQGIAHSPNGHWRCTLRKSDMRDDDATIGIGHSPNLPHAMLASLLKALALTG